MAEGVAWPVAQNPGSSMNGRTRTLAIIGVVALFALVAGLVLERPVERAVVLALARRATGLDIDAGALERIPGGYAVDALALTSPGGAVAVDAPRARIAFGSAGVDIALDSPHAVVEPAKLRGDERLRWNGDPVTVHVRNGSLAVARGQLPQPVLAFDAVAATLTSSPAGLRYDGSAQLDVGAAQYPVSGHFDGSSARWRASALPVTALASIVPRDAALVPQGGLLRDVTVDDGPNPSGSALLVDASVTVGTHALRGLHGTLLWGGRGLGARDIAGTLDAGIGFDVAGEFHDVAPHLGWLYDGSRELRTLGDLFGRVASEPRLRSLRLEATAPGVAYAQYALGSERGPLAISVLAVDPAEPTVRFDTAIAQDHVVSGGERTSAIAVRTGAIAGVNGDYFDIGRTYQPQGLLVRGGSLLRGPTDRAALLIDKAKHVTFAEFHLHGALHTARGDIPITEFNNWPPGYATVVSASFGKTLPPAPGRMFVALDPLGGVRYRVAEVVPLDAGQPVRFGVAVGPLVRVPLPKPGETVDLSYALEPHIDGVVAGIGGGPILIRNGAWFEDPHAPAPDERDYRWPVVALARLADDRLLFVAVDGRHPERSIGMTRPEFGALLQRLGAVDAMALDSGGSVTLVARAPGDANASVRNVPSDNSAERWISDALLLYSSAPPPTIVPVASAATPAPETRPTP